MREKLLKILDKDEIESLDDKEIVFQIKYGEPDEVLGQIRQTVIDSGCHVCLMESIGHNNYRIRYNKGGS